MLLSNNTEAQIQSIDKIPVDLSSVDFGLTFTDGLGKTRVKPFMISVAADGTAGYLTVTTKAGQVRTVYFDTTGLPDECWYIAISKTAPVGKSQPTKIIAHI